MTSAIFIQPRAFPRIPLPRLHKLIEEVKTDGPQKVLDSRKALADELHGKDEEASQEARREAQYVEEVLARLDSDKTS